MKRRREQEINLNENSITHYGGGGDGVYGRGGGDMRETWSSVLGYEGHYLVSSLGKIVSLKKKEPLLRKTVQHPLGYHQVRLCKNGIKKIHYVHRLVVSSFLKNPHQYEETNHKNGIKSDNRLKNLEWCSAGMNLRHSYQNGLRKRPIGELGPMWGRHHSDKTKKLLSDLKKARDCKKEKQL